VRADTRTGQLVQVSGAGVVARKATMIVPEGLEEAVEVDGRWYGTVQERAGGFRVDQLGRGDPAVVYSFRSPPTDWRPVQDRAAVGRLDDKSLIVTSRFYPFQNAVIDRNGTVVLTFSPQLLGPESTDSLDSWLSLVSGPTIGLERGYLQTLSDPSSLRRLLVVYDSHGRTIRVNQRELPLSFVTRLPETATVLSVQRLARQEIVAYDWTWR